MANEPRNLYQLKDVFRLLIDGVWNYIEEPVGWDKVNIKMARDKEYYGLNYEFADEKTTLLFLPKDGGDKLRAVYDTKGSDADVTFQYGYEQSSTLKIQLTGSVNFNDYNETDEGIEISIQKVYFQSLLRTRWETKVTLSADKTLDGAAITPLTPIDLKLHSKRILKVGEATQEGTVTQLPTSIVLPQIVYIQPDTTQLIKTEVEELQSMPLGISQYTAPSEQRFQFVAKEAGVIKMRWKLRHRLVILSFGAAGNIGAYHLVPIIHIYRSGVWVLSIAPAAARIDGVQNALFLDVIHQFDFTEYAAVQVNDEVYFNINVVTNNNGNQRRYNITEHTSDITIEQQSELPSSQCNVYKLFDVMNYVVKSLTGASDAVISSFFGVGGCAERFALTNGFQIRKFQVDEKPVQVSLKDIMEGSHPIWCNGLQYTQAGGADKVKIDPIKYIFKEERIAALFAKDIDFESWVDGHSKDFVFNDVEIGYQKVPENDLNTLDEFNTVHQWLMPLKTYKAKYQKVSPFITSGYLIEQQRREQFKENPSTSMSNDDSLFLIAYIEERIHKDVSFNFNGPGVTLNKPVGMVAGDQFEINKNGGGGANDGQIFTVVNKDISAVERYIITPSPAADSGVGELQITIATPEAEKNEPFDQVDNVISPETCYNLRITPKRNLFNHSELLNSCVEMKAGAELVKSTFVKQNGELITKFNSSITCILVDENVSFKENEDIELDHFNTRRQLFKPQTVKFKIKMTYDQLIYIKERVMGMSGTAQDYGVIAHPDIHGNMWESYVWDLDYEPEAEICTLILRKKRKIG